MSDAINTTVIAVLAAVVIYGVVLLTVCAFWARDRAALKEARKNDARDPKTGRFIKSK